MGSNGAATAALVGRGNRVNCEDDTGYQIILPPLPKGRVVLNTVFLHGDVRARPYRAEDFRDALGPTGLLPEVLALGAYQINHVWAVTMNNADATKRLLDVKELKVKGRRCIVVDPQDQQVRLRLHWLIHGVADEDVRTALAAFGKVTDVCREHWRVPGLGDKGSSTRTVSLQLKAGLTLDDLPHQLRVSGIMALVVVPGRPPLCLRCQRTGHIRRDCRVPRCKLCRRFGHDDSQCAKTYASVASQRSREDPAEHIMDEVDAAEAGGDKVSEPISPAVETSEGENVKSVQSENGDVPCVQQETATPTCVGKDAPDTAPPSPGNDEEDMDVASSSSAKRPHGQVSDGDDGSSEKVQEPPRKDIPYRRSSFKPKPNVPPDSHPTVTKAPP
ncbi:uncharacterized protein LOC125944068 [Dermacentor silvarum]|uniref:uncharacterized protein LOC125944068 n=1 Tax=Dermacentor silvarum TaxID=543639 RepID=UPI002100FE6C|nr:uncharacterized protein LOC125944068 [Dermacentor silvarum]